MANISLKMVDFWPFPWHAGIRSHNESIAKAAAAWNESTDTGD